MITTIFTFYTLGAFLLSFIGFIWYKAFQKNFQRGYLGALFASMVTLSIMFFWGINVTQNNYEPEKSEFLMLIGVPGFTGIFMGVITLVYILYALKEKKF